MTHPAETTTVHVTHLYAVPAERVYDAWLDPQLAGRFLFATPTGEMIHCEIEPHVGGRFLITERRDGVAVEHSGEYLALERPRHVVFTLCVSSLQNASTHVDLHLAAAGEGSTLTLTHSGVEAQQATRVAEGWNAILTALAVLL